MTTLPQQQQQQQPLTPHCLTQEEAKRLAKERARLASGGGVKKNKASWLETLITKAIDSLRVKITNVHVRVESTGPEGYEHTHT